MTDIKQAIYDLQTAARAAAPERHYLGASAIGAPCERSLWYDFRHCSTQRFEGRMLRLFETGAREEDRIIAELRAAGYEIHDRNPNTRRQWEIGSGHFFGHLDGLILDEQQWHVLEIKTSNTRAFRDTVKKGVREAKPVHYAQMQVYIGQARELWARWALGGDAPSAAVYIMVCKETDDMHVERVPYDADEYARIMSRAKRIIEAVTPPDRLHDDPKHRDCLWCGHSALCHSTGTPRIDCRTCLHSYAAPEAWRCDLASDPIPTEVMVRGCPRHLIIPALMERLLGAPDVVEADRVRYLDGTVNGRGGQTSELLAAIPF